MAHIRDEMRMWVSNATRLIRFGPDRETVSKELMEHIEDKTLDIQRIFPGMTERDAMQRALDQMGDAEEIAHELGKIHKPWLGWLWRASQVLVWSALIICVLGILGNDLSDCIDRLYYAAKDRMEYSRDVGEIFGDNIPEGERRLALYYPGAEKRLGKCTVSVPRAARYQPEGEETALYLEMCFDYDEPAHRSDFIFSFLWAEDDLGNRYMENGHRYEAEKRSGLTKTYRCLILDVPEEAEWIEFHYEYRPGLELRVDLTQEVRG